MSILSKAERKKEESKTLDLKNKRNPEITQHQEKIEMAKNTQAGFIQSKSLSDKPTCTFSKIQQKTDEDNMLQVI